MSEIVVSICCITYNHEKYIEDAINGFLMQKTNFPIEIIIHDDASTDKTADIVRNYEKKYPYLIKPIYQSDNQYSKGIKISPEFVWKKASGKYIALCEGDDYWTDSHKLQKQVDFLEKHSECIMCFHPAKIIDVTSNDDKGFIKPYNRTLVLKRDTFLYGGGSIAPTASLVFSHSAVKNLPEFYYKAPVGDVPLLLILLNYGQIGYINEVMSVRNLWIPGSYMTKHRKEKTNDQKIEHINKMINVLDDFNIYSNGKWNKDINRIKTFYSLQILELQGVIDLYKSAEFRSLLSRLSFIDKVKVIGNKFFTVPYMKLRKFIIREKNKFKFL